MKFNILYKAINLNINILLRLVNKLNIIKLFLNNNIIFII